MSEDLSQANLSDRTLAELNPAERAELKRRFNAFVAAVGERRISVEPKRPKDVRKWQPGAAAPKPASRD